MRLNQGRPLLEGVAEKSPLQSGINEKFWVFDGMASTRAENRTPGPAWLAR
jgi:hypothetical protein